jgi:hypothetical protein
VPSGELAEQFERVERHGRKAAGQLILLLAHTSIVVLLRDLPVSLLLMKMAEREQLALLRGRIIRERIGTCERALRSLGRRIDRIWRGRK